MGLRSFLSKGFKAIYQLDLKIWIVDLQVDLFAITMKWVAYMQLVSLLFFSKLKVFSKIKNIDVVA